MDAFYASVELLRRPELAGLPVAIGGRGDPSRRGVVTTATYPARAFGIRSGMALRTAARLCPDCVFLPVDFDEYRRMSRLFKAAIRTLADEIEDRGIDEVYIELTEAAAGDPAAARALAVRIKQAVRDATGLSCSVGLAGNKLLAKIASDLDKPDGLTVIGPGDLQRRIWPLPARSINGIGPKAEARLTALGIGTIGELAATDPALLVERFGPGYGRWLHDAAHGRDDRAVVTFSEPVSMSRETTFERDLHPRGDWHALAATLAEQAQRVADDLQRKGYVGRTIGVKLRYDDFRIVTRSLSLAAATSDTTAIRRAAFECFARIAPDRRMRLLGVRVGALSRAGSLAAHDVATGAIAGAVAVPPAGPAARQPPAVPPGPDTDGGPLPGETLPLF